jgi:hypothetical protein
VLRLLLNKQLITEQTFSLLSAASTNMPVQCRFLSGDLVSTVEEISERIDASMALPCGYWVEYGGQFESEAEAREVLLGVGALVVAGILAILIMVVRSERDARGPRKPGTASKPYDPGALSNVHPLALVSHQTRTDADCSRRASCFRTWIHLVWRKTRYPMAG